jgi:Leucine-rich repeat (LRR) protein
VFADGVCMFGRRDAVFVCVMSWTLHGSLSCGGRSTLDAAESWSTANGGLINHSKTSRQSSAGFDNAAGVPAATGGTPGSTATAVGSGGLNTANSGLAGSGGVTTASGGQSGTGDCIETHSTSENESLIDDMENGSGRILSTDGRVGAWYALNSGEDTKPQVPAPTTPGVPILPDSILSTESLFAPCRSKRAMHTWGGEYLWAGIGFDLNFDGSTYGTYNANSYAGFTFFAAGVTSSNFEVRVGTRSTTSTKYGGTCTYDEDRSHSEGCQPHYSYTYLDDDFGQHWLPFNALVPYYGEASGDPTYNPVFEKDLITNVQFYNSWGDFDFWIDDVSFYSGQPGFCAASPAECRGVINFDGTQVSNSLGRSSLSCADVCYIEVLSGWGSTSTANSPSLNGLQCLVSLRNLQLNSQKLDDIGAVSGLTRLKHLDLNTNTVSDLRPLARLTQLKYLNLSHNLASDTTPLASLNKLSTLILTHNNLSIVDGLAGLTQLTWLDLSDNTIKVLLPLESLTALQTLYLANNVVVDVAPLSRLTQLYSLDLSHNSVADVSPLSTLTNLTRLGLTYNQIRSLVGFGHLPQLPSLDLSNNQISDLANFGDMATLNALVLSNNQLSAVQFGNLPSLQTLDLSNNQITDLSHFGNLPALSSVNLSNNQLRNLTNAGVLPKLVTLDLTDNQLSDVAGVASMGSIKSLYLTGNYIHDGASLAELVRLDSLSTLRLDNNRMATLDGFPILGHLAGIDLSNNELTDVTPLAQIPSLTGVLLAGNQISDVSALGALEKLTYLDLQGSQISDLSPFLNFTWAPPDSSDQYTLYSTLKLQGNPINCTEQSDNIAKLKSYKLNVFTDCPSGN